MQLQLVENKIKNKNYRKVFYSVFVLAFLAVLFQVGHFFEHVIQLVAWLFGYREKPYMTEFGIGLVSQLGDILYDEESAMRKMMLGMETLHLIGNTIFLFGIGTMFYFLRVKMMACALTIQIFHFYEHISLTTSSIFISQAIGFSTLFGMPMDQYMTTAYRVWWHFLFNAVPTALVIFSLTLFYMRRKKDMKLGEDVSF